MGLQPMIELWKLLLIITLGFVTEFVCYATNSRAKTIIIHLFLPRVSLRFTRGYRHLTALVSENSITTSIAMLSSTLYSAFRKV